MPEPLESEEQKAFVEWLNYNKIKHSAIPNSTYTKSWKQKINNKLMGLNPGLPDLLLIVNNKLVFIEMKRRKSFKISDSQAEWIKALNECDGVKAYIAFSCDEAISIVENILKI
jgi:NAD+--asparagine ADP-ribosyltransferase